MSNQLIVNVDALKALRKNNSAPVINITDQTEGGKALVGVTGGTGLSNGAFHFSIPSGSHTFQCLIATPNPNEPSQAMMVYMPPVGGFGYRQGSLGLTSFSSPTWRGNGGVEVSLDIEPGTPNFSVGGTLTFQVQWQDESGPQAVNCQIDVNITQAS